MLGFLLDRYNIQEDHLVNNEVSVTLMKTHELILLVLIAIITFYAVRTWMKRQVELELKALRPPAPSNLVPEKPVISGFAGGIVMA